MTEESKTPKELKLKLHIINLFACGFAFLSVAGFFLIGMHNGVVFSEAERIGLFGLMASAVGGAIYSAKTLPGSKS